ncbi:MAG: penicillin-binding transpeptidase domain-containing protein [Acutalibacteraceae bacterium]
MKNTKVKKRTKIIIVLISVVFFAFLVHLFDVQVFQSEEQKDAAVTTVDVTVSATRGEIYDCNGYPLATNKQVNSIVIDYLTFPPGSDAQARNKVIDSLITLFKKNSLEWNDNLPIRVKNGKLVFDEDQENEIAYLKSSAFLDLNYYASIDNCFDALVERYSLQDYSLSKARDIASVYYSMRKNGFNSSTPYVFASDVSQDVVNVIKEQSNTYVGVDVQVRSKRVYTDGTIAPHIIGIVGSISQEEYEEKKDDGYTMNDVIGKSGLEYTLEEYLRGTPGIKRITIDSSGNRTETFIQEPVDGNSVVLTIDRNIQKVAQDALEELILTQQQTNSAVKAGSVVVMNTKNNAILACASYPTYDLSTYDENYKQLSEDTTKPLWNRALRSVYTPGSTIKPCVAMAGLEEGIIDSSTTVYCSGIYTHYQDYQPGCTGTHGSQNVVSALFNSCNIFFYETSRLLGIEKLNDYFTMFGLGEKTGVEITENEGTVDSVEHRTAKGELWTPGLTIQAGIGHGDNQFTPVQLCSYVSTIANRGIRYKAHFIKSIKTADYSQTVAQEETQILSQAKFKEKNWDLVHKGMLLVGTESYADFSKVPVTVAAKTGTTTVKKKVVGKNDEINNGFLITFAPYEDPEIAISVVVEGASSGGSTAPIASAVMEYYFAQNEKTETVQQENTLID